MKYIPSFVVAAALSAFAAPVATAAVITIDDFTTFQQVTDLPSGGIDNNGTVCGAGIIGGCRYMQVENNQNATSGTDGIAENGILRFDNGSGLTGTIWLVYAGAFDAGTWTSEVVLAGDPAGITTAPVNTTGLNVNLNVGPNPFFTFSGANFDVDGSAIFDAFVWDMGGRFVTYNEILGDADFSELLPFTAFSGDADFDWGAVGAIAFRLQATTFNYDGSLQAITVAPVPLPAAAWLLLGGLGSLAAAGMAKRRRHS